MAEAPRGDRSCHNSFPCPFSFFLGCASSAVIFGFYYACKESERSAMSAFWLIGLFVFGVLFHFLLRRGSPCRYDWTYKFL